MPLNVRLTLIDPTTGRVDTGLMDGSDPRQFASFEEARQYILQNGETIQQVNNAQEAQQIVQQYTGNPGYQGYQPNYQPPAAQAGSPSAQGQPYIPTWADPNIPGTPAQNQTPSGPALPPQAVRPPGAPVAPPPQQTPRILGGGIPNTPATAIIGQPSPPQAPPPGYVLPPNWVSGGPNPGVPAATTPAAPTPYQGPPLVMRGAQPGGPIQIDPATGLVDTGFITLPDGRQIQNPQTIPSMGIPAPDLVPGAFSNEQQRAYVDFMNNLAGQVQQQYNYTIPDAQAAQMNTGAVPQPGAAQQQITPELMRMLAGEGYSPATLAGLRSRATEDVAGAGRTALSQSRIALGQAGLGSSPAGAAIQSDLARRNAMEQSSALRDIDIQNALAGMQNFQTGVGYQTQIGSGNMQAANAMALANANRLFESMSQNIANQQQANMASFGANVERLGNQAGATTGTLQSQGQAWQQANLGKAAQADETNTANRINWATNNAQLERQRQLANQQQAEGRWQTGTSIMGGFAPSAPGLPGGGTGFNPLGAMASNFGASLVNQGLNRLNQPPQETFSY